MKTKTVFLLLCFFSFVSISFPIPVNMPGNQKGMIKAVIRDANTNSPIEYANVTVHNSIDSSFVNGTVSGNNGELVLANLPEGKFYVTISYIGYEKKLIPDVTISTSKSEVSLGVIKLAAQDVKLGAVNVVAEKPSEELHLDKKVINVSQNLNASGGTALDVLQNQPSIQVDQDGNVTLRGNSNFTVQVNGKPSPLQGSDALRQIPANMIDNIELITNPSAKYDAEGSAGIINIVLKKQTENSTSGVVNAGAGSRTKYNGDFTLNYKTPEYSFTGSFDYRKNTNTMNQYFDRLILATPSSPASLLRTSMGGVFERDNYNLKAGIDYNLSDNSSLSYSLSYGQFSMNRDFNFEYTDFRGTENGNELYKLSNDKNDLDVKYLNSSIYFTQQFEPKVEELSFEATYTNVAQPSLQTTKEYSTDGSFNTASSNPAVNQLQNDTKRNDARIKLNYFHTFGEKAKFEAGVQTNLAYRNINIESRMYDLNSTQWQIDPSGTYQFDFRNNIYSSYLMYTNQFLGFDYQLGLRAEQTDRLLNQKTLGSDYKYNKIHLFPSLNASTKISDAQQIQLSYSRRINRPNEFLLNPFPNVNDAYIYSIGNPGLLPELTHSVEVNYQWITTPVFFSVQTYYRNSENSFSQTQTLESDGRVKLSFDNIAKSEVYGAEFSSNITAAQWLKIDPSINLYNSKVSGIYANEQRERKIFAWSSRLNTTVSFSSVTKFQVMLNYIGKQQDLQSTIDPIVFLTMTLKHDLFDRKLSVSLTAQNLFNAGRFNLTSVGNNFDLIGKIRPEAPVFRLNLSYNFNNFKNTSKTERVDINVNEGL